MIRDNKYKPHIFHALIHGSSSETLGNASAINNGATTHLIRNLPPLLSRIDDLILKTEYSQYEYMKETKPPADTAACKDLFAATLVWFLSLYCASWRNELTNIIVINDNKAAFEQLHVSKDEVSGICSMLACILHLGNITMVENRWTNEGKICQNQTLTFLPHQCPTYIIGCQLPAQLLHVDATSLATTLNCSQYEPPFDWRTDGTGSDYFEDLEPKDISNNRHLLATALYSSIFHFLIDCINHAFSSLVPDATTKTYDKNKGLNIDGTRKLLPFKPRDPFGNMESTFVNDGAQHTITVVDAFTYTAPKLVRTWLILDSTPWPQVSPFWSHWM